MPMVSTYTRDEAITFVRADLSAKGVKFYTDTDVLRGIKRAYRQFAGDLKFYKTTAQENSQVGVFEYGWPDLCLGINAVQYDGRYLSRRSEEWLEARNKNWRNDANSTPTEYYVDPFAKIVVHPAPPTVITNALVYHGYFVPTFPASGSNVFTLPEAHEDLLITLSCAMVCLKDLQGFGGDQYQAFISEYNRELAKALEHGEAGNDTVVGEQAAQGTAAFHLPTLRMP